MWLILMLSWGPVDLHYDVIEENAYFNQDFQFRKGRQYLFHNYEDGELKVQCWTHKDDCVKVENRLYIQGLRITAHRYINTESNYDPWGGTQNITKLYKRR